MIGSLWGDLDGIPERSGQITGETGVHRGPAFPAGFPGRPASVVRLPHLPLTRSPTARIAHLHQMWRSVPLMPQVLTVPRSLRTDGSCPRVAPWKSQPDALESRLMG